jgi:multicomponent Na+:H+ antiporter subunit D
MNIPIPPEFTPALIVAIPLFGAFLTPLIGRVNDKLRNIFAILILGLTGFLVFWLAFNIFQDGSIFTYVFGGSQEISLPVVRIIFEVDALSIFMAIISVIVAFVGTVYSWAFMKKNTGLDKYYTLVLLMTAGMLGMELTGDMFNFFVFLEITSIASCALIAFWTNKGKAVEAGFKYMVISTIGALFILFAIALLYGHYNALNMAVLASLIEYTFLDKIALVLLIAALAMKAGIVPMHMWLPDAYGRAPAPISLILVGATQASLYGVLRVVFTLYGNSLSTVLRTIGEGAQATIITLNASLGTIIIVLAVITIFVGVIMALKQSDFKRMIAYAAVAEIGYMILAIGAGLSAMGTEHGAMALKGGVFHIINDALDIGLLFLVAGSIYYATKETSLDRLGGLARNMKYTTIFFIIGLLAVSGMPPMNGFASKLVIYESVYQVSPLLAIVAILASIMLLAVFVKVFHSVFLGPAMPKFKNVKEVPKSMLIAMGTIATIIIIFGLFPELVMNNIVEPAANALINYGDYVREVIPSFTGGV